MGLQVVLLDVFGIGVVGLYWYDVCCVYFGGFFDDEIGVGFFDWCKDQLQVGWIKLWCGLFQCYDIVIVFGQLLNLGQLFIIVFVEQQDVVVWLLVYD